MRWYKACLLEGRSPLFCSELQYPVGVPLGNFSPLHVQSVLYLAFSSVIANDCLCYNLRRYFPGLGRTIGFRRLPLPRA